MDENQGLPFPLALLATLAALCISVTLIAIAVSFGFIGCMALVFGMGLVCSIYG